MKRLLIAVVFTSLVFGCAHAADRSEDLRTRASQRWQQKMGIIDESIAWWKTPSGTAPYSPDEITAAIDFFETTTKIYSGVMSFIGPIPDDELAKAREQWQAWYRANGDRLILDPETDRVIMQKENPEVGTRHECDARSD